MPPPPHVQPAGQGTLHVRMPPHPSPIEPQYCPPATTQLTGTHRPSVLASCTVPPPDPTIPVVVLEVLVADVPEVAAPVRPELTEPPAPAVGPRPSSLADSLHDATTIAAA